MYLQSSRVHAGAVDKPEEVQPDIALINDDAQLDYELSLLEARNAEEVTYEYNEQDYEMGEDLGFVSSA
jgi:hypothetical protein